MPPVAYGGYHIDRILFSRGLDDGRPSIGGIALPGLVVAPAAGLVPEINGSPFCPGPFFYGGIFLFQPSFVVFGLLLESFPYRLLGRVPPFFQIAPHLPTGQLHAEPF